MRIKKLLLLIAALYASHHNVQLSAMHTLPTEVKNLIFSWLPMRSILNFMETAQCYAKLHEDNIPTQCVGCAINTKNKVDKDGKEICIDLKKICAKISKISIVGSLVIKGYNRSHELHDGLYQTLITDLQLFDFDINSKNMGCLIPLVANSTIKTLTIAQEPPQTQRVYIDIHYMTYLLQQMPYLEQCVLSHVALHCNDQNTCHKFRDLGTELFRTQQLEIHNSSIGYHDTVWIQIALRESKTIEELILNNIYTRESHNYEEDNYTDPIKFKIEQAEMFLDIAFKSMTMRRLTLNDETYNIKKS
jgi:hypothetical protein